MVGALRVLDILVIVILVLIVTIGLHFLASYHSTYYYGNWIFHIYMVHEKKATEMTTKGKKEL